MDNTVNVAEMVPDIFLIREFNVTFRVRTSEGLYALTMGEIC
jgi:hypothetical protein